MRERSIIWQEFIDADEVFSTGNHGKVLPVTRVESRHLQPGPVAGKARQLYLGVCAWRKNLKFSRLGPRCKRYVGA